MSEPFHHPVDTMISSITRFLSELVAWISGPWLAFTFHPWLAPVALIVLVGLPSIFSTPGDKKTIVVATPAPIRIVIELILFAVAGFAPWWVWPDVAAMACSLLAGVTLLANLRRFGWLLRGAPV